MNYWPSWDDRREFSCLLGKTLVEVEAGDDRIEFRTSEGETYVMHHNQDCCESVTVESVVGDLSDLIGEPLLLAEESSSTESHPSGFTPEYEPESFTWTFYKLATRKGYVDIRWFGTSNGYYSESVDFHIVPKEEA